jgi:FAD/FMN-containing dehydrogenase/Fe-S oxidoreductase
MHLDFSHELKKRFVGDLRVDSASKVLYSTDSSMYQIEPLGVAIPKNQDDLQSVVELAAKYKVPILPRGSGSSLGGQAIGEALILDCSRYLDAILEINPETHSALVQPGVILSHLNRAAARHGLMFGPDPASAERATMGGVISNNATGAHSILYGMSADHLLSAEVILSDGSLATFDDSIFDPKTVPSNSRISNMISVIQEIREKHSWAIRENYPISWRNSAGYRLNYLLPFSHSKPPQWKGDYPAVQPSSLNLPSLLAGSEGTLAVIRELKVNLVARPKHTILGVLSYQSIDAACDDVPRLLEFNPSAIELIPRMIIQLARGVPAYERQLGWMVGDPAAVLVIEFSGDQPSALKDAVRRLGNVLTIAESAEEQARVWNIRKMGLGILDSRPQAARPAAFIEDCAVPVGRLGEFVREVERILAEHNTIGGIYAHASGGCLHIRPILDLHRGEGVRAMRSIVEQVFALVMRLGGSMSSEHGDGIVSGEFIERTYGRELTDAMRALKRAADPDNLLNPKKMFDAPPMDTHLRYGAGYQAKPWASALHFEHEHGLEGAIELCNGQGVCRKDTGVMCPSFQATREEAFSTRGRANLLRHLMRPQTMDNQQQKMVNGLSSAVYESLDLCLACKGCTSECPSGVDMPKLKYEFMHEYYKSHRRPLHDYLFGYFHIIAKWLQPVAPLANRLMQMGWSHKLAAHILGVTDQRPFPVFARTKAAPQSHSVAERKTVLFLSDVFSQYLEPQVAQAAFDLLNFAGYEVKVLSTIGAGASFLSKGFIDQARSHAEKVLDEIKSLSDGVELDIVGCEPPEVYCLKHEYVGLLPQRREEIARLSKNVWLVDEFLLRIGTWDASLESVSSRARLGMLTDKKVVFQPHCHQRAEGLADDGLPSGTAATMAMLRMAGFKAELINAGCCGMAGTFGYDAEHYELAMQIGELGVLPKLRKWNAESREQRVASTGSACRIQIRHGTGIDARHPLELVRDVLLNKNSQI